MRLDKFLKNARLIKRRTVANEACTQGRVKLNEKSAKAGAEVKIGDKIEIQFGERTVKVEVLSISDHVPKGDASGLYRVIE
ncbi:MAG: RNA-binding S4 domain-containing protein [Firmicutes bacterium]|nr:RNA-binding S4 domain-containing protein [Bacillota bacterium]